MKISTFILASVAAATFSHLSAQTTLSGNHIITGDLDVGTTADKGNLEVVGKTGAGSDFNLKVSGDGGIYFPKGTASIAPVLSAGDGFFYYSSKKALHLGVFSSISLSNMGAGSMVIGSGFAIGQEALSVGNSHASGFRSLAVGGAQANGNSSIATGMGIAGGVNSSGFGSGYASGNNSMALGSATYAVGVGGFAAGASTQAVGNHSAAFGSNSTAQPAFSFVIGRYNTIQGDPATWVATDPLFVVGNGTGSTTQLRSNAFVIYKNGDVRIPKAQGDILMGEFGN